MRRIVVGIILCMGVVLGLAAVAGADAPYPPEPKVEVRGEQATRATQGSLAFTGSDWTAAVAVVGVVLVLAGVGMVAVTSSRRSAEA